MIITRDTVAAKIGAYLRQEISLTELVDWAERGMMDGELENSYFEEIRDALARLGLADVRSFGLTWEDCEQLLQRLGYAALVEIRAIS